MVDILEVHIIKLELHQQQLTRRIKLFTCTTNVCDFTVERVLVHDRKIVT